MNIEYRESARELINHQFKRVKKTKNRKDKRDEYCIMVGMLKLSLTADIIDTNEMIMVLNKLEKDAYIVFDREALRL